MEPVFRSDFTLQALSAKNVLTNQGDEGGVLGVMVERVAQAETLEDEPRGLPYQFRIARLTLAEGLIVEAREMIAECVSDNRCGVEHRERPPGRMALAIYGL